MGREGEVVAELLPEFERAHPGIRVERAAAAVDRRAREAADRVRRRRHARHLPARQHLDPGVRRARTRSSRSTRASRSSPVVDAARLLRRHLGHQRRRRQRRTACRGTSTRACCSTAATCSRDAGFAAPPRDWAEWTRDAGAIKRRSAPRSLRDPAAAQRVRAAARPRAAAGEPLLRDDGRYGNFRSAGFRRALAFYVEMFQRRLAPPCQRTRRSRTCGTSSAAATSRSTSPGPGTSASSSGACRPTQQDDWTTAPLPGPDGPGRLDRRRLEPGACFARSRAQGGGVEADRVPVAAADAAALPRADRRPAAAPQRLGETRAGRRPLMRAPSATSSSASSPRRRCPSGSASPPRCGSSPSAWCDGRLDGRRRPPPSSTAAPTRILEKRRWMLDRAQATARREAAPRRLGVRRARRSRDRACSSSLPVLAALALSLTDFDIYALADLRNLRFVGLAQLHRSCCRPAVLAGARQHALLRRGRRAAVDRGVARRGAAAAFASWRGSSRSSAPRSSRRW